MPPVLDERGRRLWAAAESVAIGYVGDALVSAATRLARQTIANGRRELADGVVPTTRVRRVGAGRPVIATQPGLAAALDALVGPLTRGGGLGGAGAGPRPRHGLYRTGADGLR